MAFSDRVAQQREKQAKALKHFVMASLAGSVGLHIGGLFLRTSHLWEANEPVSEEITIIVTEDEPEVAIAPDEPLNEPPAVSEFSAPLIEPFSAPTVVDEFTTAEPVAEPPVEQPVPTNDPVSDEAPVPIAEAITPEEPAVTESREDATVETSEAIAPSETTARDLSNLLAELRRTRQQPAASGPARLGEAGPPSSSDVARPGATTAAAPGRPGVGIGSPSPAPAPQERRSREITCRGCDFDYPESADGAEGTAQVVVETDGEGRVVSVMLSRSSGNAALDQAALEQARRRVRLNNARAGESYPIDVDFVQPNSEAAERVRERGDRRSITVSEPAPETVEAPTTPEAPENASSDPQPTPDATPLPPTSLEAESPSPEPSETPEPSELVILEPQPAAIPQPTPSPELKPTTVPAPQPCLAAQVQAL